MTGLLTDIRYGVRLLCRAPVFAAVAVVTLGLGIGANTAIFSTVYAVLVRTLPYADPDRLVMVWEDASFASFPKNTPAPGNYLDWRTSNRVFTDMAATSGLAANITADGPPEQVIGRRVTANFFDVLGARPLLGRTFTDEENRHAAQVAIISHRLWLRRYSGDPSIVGRTLLMDGASRTIVGVMPREFVFRNRELDLWAPMPITPDVVQNRSSHVLNVVARLRPGVTLAQAREDMSAIAARLATDYPETNRQVGAVVGPLRDELLGTSGVELLVLMAAAGCVLLIACANLANLLLSRAVVRRSELAVRLALGASSARIVRQMIVEGLILALAGGGLGLLIAPFGLSLIQSLVPTALSETAAPGLDARVLTFSLALSLATGVLFSLAPALHATRASVSDGLQQGRRGQVGASSRMTRDGLVVIQVATAFLLLVGAGLMLRTLANLHAVDLGFTSDRLLTMRTTLPQGKYQDPARHLAFYDRVVDGVRALPGVQSAAYSSMLPFLSRGNTNSYRVEGRAPIEGDPQDALFRVGTNDYLKTIGVRLVEGRLPDARDTPTSPLIIVVNEHFARKYWSGESALGHRVATGDGPWRTIVGVVKDVRERGYELDMKPGLYLPYAQIPQTWPDYLVLRIGGDPLAIAGAVRRVIATVDPEQPVASVRTMSEILDLEVADRQQQMTLLVAFALLALLLAMLGVYGVLSYAVTQRRREIGLRIALGASAGSVMRMIVNRGLALTGIGVAIGLALAWAATRAVSSLLYGVAATDARTFASVTALLAAMALGACLVPALRAARVDPMNVLRQD